MNENEVVPVGRGLARERTALAWNRSGLAAVVCAAILLRRLWPISGSGQDIALALVAGAAVVWSVVLFSSSRSNGGRVAGVPIRPRILVLATVATVMLALVGCVLAFLTPG